LEVAVSISPSLSVTVNSNKYEFAFTFPTTVGAVKAATEAFFPLSEIGGGKIVVMTKVIT
jgi:hypothetical protein